MTKKYSYLLIFAFGTSLSIAAEPPKAVTPSKKIETSRVPDSYKKRIAKFNSIISQEPNRASLVKKAISLAKNPKSEFRVDAINLLAELKAKDSLQDLMVLSQDSEIRPFTIFALGEIPSEKSIPLLIHFLDDPDENVRGNAMSALQKITGMRFQYDYSFTGEKQKQGIEEVSNWWKLNKATFVVKEQTPEEKKAAEDAWEKYGRQYIRDLSR